MRKVYKLLFVIGVTIAATIALTGCVSGGVTNYHLFDTTWQYDWAYILLPNGKVIEGRVQNWRDYEDGDQIQVKIDNKVYLTDTTRCVLVKNE